MHRRSISSTQFYRNDSLLPLNQLLKSAKDECSRDENYPQHEPKATTPQRVLMWNMSVSICFLESAFSPYLIALPAITFGGVALDTTTLLALVVVGFFAGVGITAIGPGGIFVTIALSLVIQRPGLVAGTAGATNIATGIVGSVVYASSGELRTQNGRRLALLLSLAGLAGALLGAGINAFVSAELFAILLGGFVAFAGVLTWYREQYGSSDAAFSVASRRGAILAAGVGFVVGVPGGLLGVGGPVLAVPLLVALGTPLVVAVAVAQVQSVFIAGFATLGYLIRDAVSVWLVAFIGVPELIGVVVGWRVAHTVDPRRLKLALAVVLVLLGPYIALS